MFVLNINLMQWPAIFMIFIAIIVNIACGDESDHFNSANNCTLQLTDLYTYDDTKVNLRISNMQQYDFCQFEILAHTDYFNYGNITANSTTAYTSFDTLYQNTSLRFIYLGKNYEIIVHNHIGDTIYTSGNYTMQVSIINDSILHPYTQLIID